METILYPLIGGIIIAISSSMVLGGLGKIAGITGILEGALHKPAKNVTWRYAFLVGLIVGGFIMVYSAPQFFQYELKASPLTAIIAGLLVGYGTRLGSGCTSGHGVCGLPRLAKRSWIATITFIGFGVLTVAIKGALS